MQVKVVNRFTRAAAKYVLYSALVEGVIVSTAQTYLVHL